MTPGTRITRGPSNKPSAADVAEKQSEAEQERLVLVIESNKRKIRWRRSLIGINEERIHDLEQYLRQTTGTLSHPDSIKESVEKWSKQQKERSKEWKILERKLRDETRLMKDLLEGQGSEEEQGPKPNS